MYCGINGSLIHLVNKLLGYAVLTINAWVFYERLLLAHFEYYEIIQSPLWCLKAFIWWRAFWNHGWSRRVLDIALAILGMVLTTLVSHVYSFWQVLCWGLCITSFDPHASNRITSQGTKWLHSLPMVLSHLVKKSWNLSACLSSSKT